MTREDAKRIIDNIEIVKHFANGGEVVFPYVNHQGCHVRYEWKDTMLLSCLHKYKIAPKKTMCPTCGQEVKEE